MRYRIEFLEPGARAEAGANGFQIRDMCRDGRTVSLTPFDDNGGLWGDA